MEGKKKPDQTLWLCSASSCYLAMSAPLGDGRRRGVFPL